MLQSKQGKIRKINNVPGQRASMKNNPKTGKIRNCLQKFRMVCEREVEVVYRVSNEVHACFPTIDTGLVDNIPAHSIKLQELRV